MQRKAVSNDDVDPGLNKGYSYIVDDKAYKAWLATAKHEPEVFLAHADQNLLAK
jgi:hypothetical protein